MRDEILHVLDQFFPETGEAGIYYSEHAVMTVAGNEINIVFNKGE